MNDSTKMNTCDKERRRIIQRLIKNLTLCDTGGIATVGNYIGIATKLTGLHPKMLKELESVNVYQTKIEPVDRSVIYNKLVNFYVEKNKIPCTYNLFMALHGEIPPYIDIGNFRKILVKMDFVWKKVTATCAVVIEKPLVRFERYNYLKKVQFYRTSHTDIYYIDNGSFDSSGNFRDYKSIDVSQRFFYAVGPGGIHAFEQVDVISNETFEEWVRDSLLLKIHRSSVFIMKNSEHHNEKILETPTLESFKSVTISWLDRHGITYDPKMSKYELFALAEKYTDLNNDLFKIDQLIKAKGHVVLRIPRCIENMTSAALLNRAVNETLSVIVKESGIVTKNELENVITSAAALYIEEFEKHLALKEDELVKMEDRVDEVYDTLIGKAGSVNHTDDLMDSDLPSSSDSE